MGHEIETHLQRIACVSVAAIIWERELLKNETKDLFCSEEEKSREDNWHPFLKEVIQSISPDFVPVILYQDLLDTIKCMGLRIRGWFEYLCQSEIFCDIPREHMYKNYMKKIYWTHYGTIDELKIFKLYWLNNPNADIWMLYNMACYYCIEEEENNLWEKKNNEGLNFYEELYDEEYSEIYEEREYNILAFWNNVRNPSEWFIHDLSELSNGDPIYDINLSIPENMLRLCASQGNHIGFKYFWKLLNDEKKRNNTLVCLELVLERMNNHNLDVFLLYIRDTHAEICRLLLQNATGTERIITNLVMDSDEFAVLLSTFSCCPWQELISSVLQPLLLHFNKHDFIRIFHIFLNDLQNYNTFHCPTGSNELHRKSKQLWHIIPSDYKLYTAQRVMPQFFRLWDIKTAKMIINDEDISNIDKESLLEESHFKFFQMIQNDRANKVLQFFCDLLAPKNLNNYDQDKLKMTYKCLLQNDWNWSNNFPDFLNNLSDNTKKCLKDKLAIKYINYYFIKKNELDLADEFLIWSLGSIRKVNYFKRTLLNTEFTMDHIYFIWYSAKDDLKLAASQSENFLNFLMNFCEEKIEEFKIEKFVNVNHSAFSRLLIRKFKDSDIIDDFLLWCTWTKTEIQEFKQRFKEIVSSKKIILKKLRI